MLIPSKAVANASFTVVSIIPGRTSDMGSTTSSIVPVGFTAISSMGEIPCS